jgi:hypothetical protein
MPGADPEALLAIYPKGQPPAERTFRQFNIRGSDGIPRKPRERRAWLQVVATVSATDGRECRR